jgi:flavorubredoxin
LSLQREAWKMTSAEVDLTMSPYRVADETFVVPWILEAPPVGLFCMNSLVIRGREPMIVDTGSPANRDEWLKNVWSLVDPQDVRWIFLSHDDRDHAGNLLPVLAACPNATLLTNWFSIGRMAEEWMTPLDRCRFLNDGERLEVGDRTVTAVRPPVFDNPTTRGLFDDRTGVYWSVDTFALPLSEPVEDADDVPDDDFTEGQLMGSRLVAAWHDWLDERKFNGYVDKVRSMPIEVVASCHSPAIRGARIDRAFELLRRLPGMEPWQPFAHQDLEQWLADMAPEGGAT